MSDEIRIAEYINYQDKGGQGKWDSGILQIELNSWEEFHDVTARLLNLGDFIWRGQRCDWSLKSKFDRIVISDRENKLEKHMNAFLRTIKGRRGNNPPPLNNKEEIWSLGQHYGLKTQLLDWTESPFVAAFFAFLKKNAQSEPNPNDNFRFIYALSKDIGRWYPVRPPEQPPDYFSQDQDHFIQFVAPLSDENPRLLNQKGLFTITMSEEIDIEKTVQVCYANDPDKGKSRIIFVKIKIPTSEREECLRNLNTMNINHATLFPDLIGAAEYCNLMLEIDNYA
jgi:hypothetical protein